MRIYCDGLTEPYNRGDAQSIGTWAFCVYDDINTEVYQMSGFLGPNQTNNRCEYIAVGMAIRWAVEEAREQKITVLTDSQLVVNQVLGRWSCNKLHLQKYRDRIIELMNLHKFLKLEWVPGTENRADVLTRLCYKQNTGVFPKPRVKSK